VSIYAPNFGMGPRHQRWLRRTIVGPLSPYAASLGKFRDSITVHIRCQSERRQINYGNHEHSGPAIPITADSVIVWKSAAAYRAPTKVAAIYMEVYALESIRNVVSINRVQMNPALTTTVCKVLTDELNGVTSICRECDNRSHFFSSWTTQLVL
jgi:phosphodiesterase/alkaline phosphatase D-like protein